MSRSQTDDIKLYGQETDYWKIVSVPDDLSSEYGWRNSKILKAISPGLGEVTATLTYFNGHQNSKEARELYFLSLNTFLSLSITSTTYTLTGSEGCPRHYGL